MGYGIQTYVVLIKYTISKIVSIVYITYIKYIHIQVFA